MKSSRQREMDILDLISNQNAIIADITELCSHDMPTRAKLTFLEIVESWCRTLYIEVAKEEKQKQKLEEPGRWI